MRQQPATVAAAQHRQRGWRRAEHAHAGDRRRGSGESARAVASTAASSRPETISAASRPKGGILAASPLSFFDREKARAVAGGERRDHRMLRPEVCSSTRPAATRPARPPT